MAAPTTRILSWEQMVREAEGPQYTRLSLQPWVYQFSNNRLFVDPLPLYGTMATFGRSVTLTGVQSITGIGKLDGFEPNQSRSVTPTGAYSMAGVGTLQTGILSAAPPQARAAGFDSLVFFDDFTSATTVHGATIDSVVPGVNWYACNTTQTSPTNFQVLTTTMASALTNGNIGGGSNASPNGGLFEIAGITSVTNNANFQTVPSNNISGNTWKHAYFEAYIQFNIDQSSPGGWPAFWSWSETSGTIVELDFLETGYYNEAPSGGSDNSGWTIHDPGGEGGSAIKGSGTMQHPVDSNWHTYGCLWTGNGTTGALSFYFDNTRVAGPITTGSGGTVPDMESITVGQFLTLGTGPGIPMYVDWVKVWQAAPGGSLAAIDFSNNTSPNAVAGVIVHPELFGVATGGLAASDFAICSNSTFQALVTALNPPLLRLNSTDWSNTPSDLAPFADNAAAMVSSTCKIIIGADFGSGGTSSQYKAVSDYWAAHGTVAANYYEVGNEPTGSISTYATQFNIGATGFHETNAAYLVGGPVWAGLNTGIITSFVGETNATNLGFIDYHQYLYCAGGSVPTNAQASLAQNTSGFAVYPYYQSSAQSAVSGTYASGYPIFLGEYNIECSASFTDLRAGTCIGVGFLISCLLGMASTSTQPAWGGIWDLYDDAGAAYQLIDTSLNVYPQYYALQTLIAQAPGNMVFSSSGVSGVQAWATYSGTHVFAAIVNSTNSNVSGTVSLNAWPVNETGNGSITLWTYPTTSLTTPAANTPASTSSVTVTDYITTSITVPANSAVMLYTG